MDWDVCIVKYRSTGVMDMLMRLQAYRIKVKTNQLYLLTWMTGCLVSAVKAFFPDSNGYRINAWTEVHDGTGVRRGLLHTHCLVTRNRPEDRSQAGLRLNGVLPDVTKCKGMDHAEALVKYHEKDGLGPNCPAPGGGLQAKIIQISAADTPKDRQWFIENLHLLPEDQMLEGTLKWNMSASTCASLRRARNTPVYTPTVTPIPWHAQALTALKALLPREVLWIFSADGNTGKSHFQDYLHQEWKEKSISYFNGEGDHMFLFSQRPTDIVFIDMPRSAQEKDWKDLARTIEKLSNGQVTVTKYHGANFRCAPPLIVVTANAVLPRNLLSEDRLKEFCVAGRKWERYN